MKSGLPNILPLILVTLLAALTYWLQQASQTTAPVRDGRNRHDPDFVIEQFSVRRFDTTGALQHILQAERMTHFPDNEATELLAPRVTALRGASPLYVSAARGTLGKDGQVAVLRDAVLIERKAAPGVPAARFSTTELTVYPNDEYATTAAPVTLNQGSSTATGTGFELNNQTMNVVLHSQVRATFMRKSP